VSWREIVCLPDRSREEAEGKHGYLDADGNGGHIYEYGWTWPVDPLRFKFAVKHNLELWHKPLWIDELGVEGGAAPVDKMRAYLQMADILLSEVNSEQHPLGQRVEFLCPFVSNGHPGSPPSWDIRYLMRDRACYELLGQWMAA
jgi:hypothetical protein